jgi:hypothetical protein
VQHLPPGTLEAQNDLQPGVVTPLFHPEPQVGAVFDQLIQHKRLVSGTDEARKLFRRVLGGGFYGPWRVFALAAARSGLAFERRMRKTPSCVKRYGQETLVQNAQLAGTNQPHFQRTRANHGEPNAGIIHP